MPLTQGPVPLYYQLETIIRSQISLGEWPVGTKIPTETEFAEKYGVSIVTVKQSLAKLAADGLISRKRGKGTFVERTIRGERCQPLEGSLSKAVVSEVGYAKVKVFDFTIIAPPASIADHLGLHAHQNVLTFKRLHYHDTPEPFSYTVNYVKEDVGRDITPEDVRVSPVINILRGKCGVKIGYAHQVMRAIIANDQLSTLLSVNIGFPMLKIERVVYAIDDIPVQYVEMFYRSDRFVFRAELKLNEG